ncbi:MAG: VIT1/CCC1 transporter family protein [Candidatus Dormibacteraeota bacterium]|nr:VIT1/CCC1 transporter family protein [Candidatus Dormibacteraeota bacterium]
MVSVDTAEARRRLLQAWRGEIEARQVYSLIAEREQDPRRASIIRQIADGELKHRARLEARMQELGVSVPDPASVRLSPWLRLQARLAPIDRLLRAREAAEQDEVVDMYGKPTGDPGTDAVLREIRKDERSHSMAVNEMLGAPTPSDEGDARAIIQSRLDRLRGRETWHRTSSGWVSDAIYGANDGLAAVFGIVAGVSGATGASERFVLTSGLAGAIASSLSMGVGAWLAARSTTEIAQANIEQERRELREKPAEEKEELSLYYQLKGLNKAEADDLVEKLARDPEVMLQTLVTEEFGGVEKGGSPLTAGVAGLVSTAVGAILPVIPFFFVGGTTGVIISFVISLVAHFVVGALKSLFTLRSWWSSGFEMTVAGIIVGGGTFLLGLVFRVST